MTKAELFKDVASAGLSGGFAYGQTLPKEPGTFDGILVVDYDTAKGASANFLMKWLIAYFGEKPIRKRESRDRQLKRLIQEAHQKNRHLVIVIHGAHLLSMRDLKILKLLHEICDGQYIGFVLIGDTEKLERKIKALPEIEMRITHKF